MPKLTAKQKRFVQEYIIDLNATQAAIRAGYSEKTASEQGYQLLQKTSVAESIQKAKKQLENRSKDGADWVVERLKYEAKTADSDSARVSALDKLGKHFGIYEEDNAQQSKAPVNVSIEYIRPDDTDKGA